MKKSPRDKMIRTNDERIKRSKKRRFFFPNLGRSVEAESQEEALKIISKQI